MIRILLNGNELRFAALPITIGRDPDNDVPLDDNKLSRRHCRIVRGADGFFVEDLESSNGTYVNGERIEHHALALGDAVRIGFTEFQVEWDASLESSRRRPRKGKVDPEEVRELHVENRRLRRVLNLTKAVAAATDEESLLRLIVDSAVELTGAERGFLFLVTLHGLDFRVARDRNGDDLEHPEDMISRSIAGEAVESGRPVVTEDAGGDARFAGGRSVAYLRLRSVLCVPLKVKDGPLGAIYLENSDVTAQFHEEDVPLVTTFCDYVALTIHAARNVVTLEAREEQLRRSRERIGRLNAKLKSLLRRQSRELAGVRADLDLSRQELGMRYDTASVVGESPAMRKVLGLVDQLLDSEEVVLVRGESGTGKQIMARAIHYNGPRRDRRLVNLNCSAVPAGMLATRLPESIQQAQGGTLMLDEYELLPDELRDKLVSSLGDARLILASSDPGAPAVKAVEIALPPLRERVEDVLPLFEHFLDSMCADQEIERPDVQPEVLDRLLAYAWPGNVRELRNEVQRMLALQRGVLTPDLLSLPVFSGDPGAVPPAQLPDGGLKELVEGLEKRVIEEILQQCGGNKTRAAATLGLSRLGLRKKIDRYGIEE
ncbi:MAG: FHA domain-containing protein [Planctomycetota bacterium]|jgi:transcriptional regulator with GAF, ATPase, and Fis domain